MSFKSKEQPWWLIGFYLSIMCLISTHVIFGPASKTRGYFYWFLVGFALLVYAVQFVRQFRQQHAQYSIRSLLILTLLVAVLCSIYTYLGFSAVVILLCLAFVVTSFYVHITDRQEKQP